MKNWNCSVRVVVAAALLLISIRGYAEEKVFNLQISNGRLPANQQVMRVTKGDNVKWKVVSDTPGELHLHAYRLSLHLISGDISELSFEAFATGRFRVEWHPVTSSNKQSESHHEEKLASFEVMPK